MMASLDSDLEHPRVAFALGRKSGPAVHRNLLRRRIQHVLRDRGADLPAGRYLIGCRGPAREISFADVVSDLGVMIGRLGATP